MNAYIAQITAEYAADRAADALLGLNPPRGARQVAATERRRLHGDGDRQRRLIEREKLRRDRAAVDKEREDLRLDVETRLAACSADARHLAICLMEGARCALSYRRVQAAERELIAELRELYRN